jgi:hypothetical protein
MSDARTTQIAAEFLVEPIPNARTSQIAAEFLVGQPEPQAITTQIVAEWLITSVGGAGCQLSWVMPSPNPYPTAGAGGPIPIYFDEVEPEWGEFGKTFNDGAPVFSTIQTARTRNFAFQYDGLDQTQAKQLDDHYNSTRGGLSFTLIHPVTAEVITGVRYESYSRSPHTRVWSQARSVKLVRYP